MVYHIQSSLPLLEPTTMLAELSMLSMLELTMFSMLELAAMSMLLELPVSMAHVTTMCIAMGHVSTM